jgi:hypothetical protein
METIDVELNDFTLRRRSLLVSHVATALPRGLEHDEQVLLRDPVHGFYSGKVADLDFDLADTLYRIKLGVRLTQEEAHERLHASASATRGRPTRQDLLDLLRRLRETDAEVPVTGRHRRTDTAL